MKVVDFSDAVPVARFFGLWRALLLTYTSSKFMAWQELRAHVIAILEFFRLKHMGSKQVRYMIKYIRRSYIGVR